jgi:hypothetical protein
MYIGIIALCIRPTCYVSLNLEKLASITMDENITSLTVACKVVPAMNHRQKQDSVM